jgi:hypothetical protein
VLGVEFSPRLLPKLSAEMADALAGPVVEAEVHVREQDFAGFLGTDRWSGYNLFDLGLRQTCWSHLTQDIQGFIDRDGAGALGTGVS